jgi:hypothetical protein
MSDEARQKYCIRRIVVDRVDYLRREKLWGLDDPFSRP